MIHGSSFAVLRHGDFRAFIGTGVLAMMADNVEHVISYWMIFQVFHSPALAGFAVISHWAPFLIFALAIGGFTDRHDCRWIMRVSQAIFVATSASWAVLFLTGSLQIWHAVVLLVLHGMAGALRAPAQQLLIHDIVGRELLGSAVRMSSSSVQLGILFGPAVGGALLLLVGPAWGLLANCLLYIPIFFWLARTPYTGHLREPQGAANQSRLSLADAARTFREVATNRTVVLMIALGGITSLLVGNAYQAQMPQFAASLGMGGSELAYSALLTATAAGAVVGGVALEGLTFFRRLRARGAIVLAIAWCISILVFALTSSYLIALAALFAAGVLSLGFGSIAQTLVQLEAPPERRGRVVGLYSMSQNGLRVGSGATIGVLGGVIGIHQSLLISAAACLLICLGLLAAGSVGRSNESSLATSPTS